MRTVGIYQAERRGVTISGTASVLAEKLGYTPRYVRMRAADYPGEPSRDGWTFCILKKSYGYRFQEGAEFIATHPIEDPIIGTAIEIAELTGMTRAWVYRAASTGKPSCGWTIKKKVVQCTDDTGG